MSSCHSVTRANRVSSNSDVSPLSLATMLPLSQMLVALVKTNILPADEHMQLGECVLRTSAMVTPTDPDGPMGPGSKDLCMPLATALEATVCID